MSNIQNSLAKITRSFRGSYRPRGYRSAADNTQSRAQGQNQGFHQSHIDEAIRLSLGDHQPLPHFPCPRTQAFTPSNRCNQSVAQPTGTPSTFPEATALPPPWQLSHAQPHPPWQGSIHPQANTTSGPMDVEPAAAPSNGIDPANVAFQAAMDEIERKATVLREYEASLQKISEDLHVKSREMTEMRADFEKRKREEDEKRQKEEGEKRKKDEDEKRKKEEDEKRKKDEGEKRKRDEDEKRKKEEDEKRKREEADKRQKVAMERQQTQDEQRRALEAQELGLQELRRSHEEALNKARAEEKEFKSKLESLRQNWGQALEEREKALERDMEWNLGRYHGQRQAQSQASLSMSHRPQVSPSVFEYARRRHVLGTNHLRGSLFDLQGPDRAAQR
ncbi:hypothetical protein ACJZ2D_015722 [Fusarium nematophilum]